MLQESVVLLAVVMVGTSMKILEKVASNLALMIHRTLPGKSWGGGEANGGMRGRKKNMDKCKEEEKHGRGWGNISFPYLLGWGLGGVLRGWGGHHWEPRLEKRVEGEGTVFLRGLVLPNSRRIMDFILWAADSHEWFLNCGSRSWSGT